METKKTFNSRRLKEALCIREMKMSELADKTGISKQSLSLYINDENIPPYENIDKISKILEFPPDFFIADDKCVVHTNNTYFRSLSTATKKIQKSQKIKMEYLTKIYNVLSKYVEFPFLNLPSINTSKNFDKPNSEDWKEEIEQIALYVREKWNIGNGPIDNLQYILESNGIIVTGVKNVSADIDAFSQKIRVEKDKSFVFVVALALGEKPIERLRFDMGHELGHILLHSWENNDDEDEKEIFSLREKQANFFASALLLPKNSFTNDIKQYPTDIGYYFYLKKKWRISIQAMIYRAKELEIITGNQYSYMMRQIAKNGWRKKEPGDIPGKLKDTIFQGALDNLFHGEYLNSHDFRINLKNNGIFLFDKDLIEIMGLKDDTLEPEDIVCAQTEKESNVIPFNIKKEKGYGF